MLRIWICEYDFPPPTNQISAAEYTFNSTHSELIYSPKDDDDFGTVYCRAENAMGAMAEPCVFTVIPAGGSFR